MIRRPTFIGPETPNAQRGTLNAAGGATSCDTLVVLGAETRDGRTLFAKNSDRPPAECQPLFQAPRQRHPPDTTVRCQYLEIPQAEETLAVFGSRPWWLWGFEHGVNECRVAIGNEALHARELPDASGLLGMDLVRLGLERGRTAGEATRVITDLLGRFGQGGSAGADSDRRYHNGFIIADPAEAWILETCGRHWVAKRVHRRGAISNLFSIGEDWSEVSPGAEAWLHERGWLVRGPGGRLDFRRSVENPDLRYRAEARLGASCRFLETAARPTAAALMRHLRDHYEGGTVPLLGQADGDPRGWSVCMHPGPGVSATAASLIAELPGDPAVPMTLWCAMGTPCTGPFLPIPFGEPLPDLLTRGEGQPSPDSLWWEMKALGDAAMRNPVRFVPFVQARWGPWESELVATAMRNGPGQATDLRTRIDTMIRGARRLRAEMA
jgi:secernin